MKTKNSARIFTHRLRRYSLACAFAVSILVILPAKAANEIPVQLRIENENATELTAKVQVPEECDVIDTTTTTPAHFTGHAAVCALQAAQEQNLLTYEVSNWGFGFALDSVNGTSNPADWSKSWMLFKNYKDPMMGVDGFTLAANDELTLSYGAWPKPPLKLEITTTTLTQGGSTTLLATIWDDASQTFVEPGTMLTFHVGADSFTTTSAQITWTGLNIGENDVWVESPTQTRSRVETVIVGEALPRSVTLRVETATGTLASANLLLPYECSVTDSASVAHTFTGYSAICALETAKTDGAITGYQVSNWGFAFAVDSINDIANAADWSTTWLLFKNLADPNLGINAFSLDTGDELLLAYSAWPAVPLSVSASTQNPDMGDTVTFSVNTWNGTTNSFEPVTTASTTISIDGVTHEVANGALTWVAERDGVKTVFAESPGAVRSATLLLNVSTPPAPPSGTCCSSGQAPVVPQNQTFNTDKAIEFLTSSAVQQSNGSIMGSALYSDWTAIAFAAYGGNNPGKELLKQYLLTDPAASVGFNQTADYSRRAMALLALGINPYNGTPTNYIQLITDALSVPDEAYNDDIFALFPLLHSGYTASDQLIVSTTAFILSKQEANGAWFGVDMTAAAVQALEQVQSLPGVADALAQAKHYLLAAQQSNGSFGNADSTSWALQAMTSLEEPQTLQFLAAKQQADGGIQDGSDNLSARVWSTAYAVPPSLGKTWSSVLTTVSKPTAPITPAPSTPAVPTPTSTVPFVTSTEDVVVPIVTSTLPLEVTPTTTEPLVTTTEEIAVPVVVSNPTLEVRFASPLENSAPRAVAGTRIETAPEEPVVNEQIATSTAEEIVTAKPEAVAQVETISESVQPSNPAKAAFRIAVGGTLALGLYLGWKFLKGVV